MPTEPLEPRWSLEGDRAALLEQYKRPETGVRAVMASHGFAWGDDDDAALTEERLRSRTRGANEIMADLDSVDTTPMRAEGIDGGEWRGRTLFVDETRMGSYGPVYGDPHGDWRSKTTGGKGHISSSEAWARVDLIRNVKLELSEGT